MDWVLLISAVLIAIPLLALGGELVLALLAPSKPGTRPAADRLPCAILIPAHNEEHGIRRSLDNLRSQIRPGDRLIVIADNCGDRTAEFARGPATEVLERFDYDNRGKGYALDHGVRHLDANPPDIVVVIDADCEVHPGSIDRIVEDAQYYQAPVQAVYLFANRDRAGFKEQISAFAMLVKNLVRPLGLHQIGMPCLLTGTGMAFPWKLFRDSEHGTGNIVEDMKLGVDLCLAGYPPRMVRGALLTTDPAPTQAATVKQRTRWEHGHVKTILTQCPRLLGTGLMRGRPSLIFAALELGIPPLSLLMASWAVATLFCAIWWQAAGGAIWPLSILIGAIIPIVLTLPLAWVKFGKGVVSGKTLLKIPFYIVWKLPIYIRLLVSPQRKWVRTERGTI